jgi:hypothetical protein
MNPGPGSRTRRRSSAFDDVPSVAQLVGVWASAVTQLWDMATTTWTAVAELGAAEETSLDVWVTSCPFRVEPGQQLDVRCTSLVNDAGQSVPLSDVTVEPTSVERPEDGGQAAVEVDVVLSRPLEQDSPAYTVTLAGFANDQMVAGTEQVFRRGFGVQRG